MAEDRSANTTAEPDHGGHRRGRRHRSERSRAGQPGIITCSALRRAYRDRLRRPNVRFVFLSGTREVISRRMGARSGHFMPLSLLDSQLATLEPPGPDEQVITVHLGGTREDEVGQVLTVLSSSHPPAP